MKYFFLLFTFLCSTFESYLSKELKTPNLEEDPAFLEIKQKLDPNWKTFIKGNLLRLERKEPVLVMPIGQTDTPQPSGETEKEKLARMKKFGMKMKPSISYRFQKRWTVNDTIEADFKKEEIQEKLHALPEKYKIVHLLDKNLSKNGGEIYTPTNKSEKRKIKEYFIEKSKLEKKIPLLPDYHLNKFSLFLISKKGVSNEYSEVYPESVLGEFLQVEKLLFKYKTKQN